METEKFKKAEELQNSINNIKDALKSLERGEESPPDIFISVSLRDKFNKQLTRTMNLLENMVNFSFEDEAKLLENRLISILEIKLKELENEFKEL